MFVSILSTRESLLQFRSQSSTLHAREFSFFFLWRVRVATEPYFLLRRRVVLFRSFKQKKKKC